MQVTIVLLLTACRCDWKEEDCTPDTGVVEEVESGPRDSDATDDQDGDGHPVDEDCDDTDPTVFPGAEEVCDGVDNDCDGDVDDDDDLDGFGVCDDCDETNAAIHPDAAEDCDGVDNDCDALVDESPDVDGDGWGLCDGDCDDANALIHPGAEEICGNGLDDDCDGEPACGPWGELAISDSDVRIDGVDIGGLSVPDQVDLTGDGVIDLVVEDRGYYLPPEAAGRAFVFAGPVTAASSQGDALLMWEGEPGDWLGKSLAVHPNPRGDGHGGLAVVARRGQDDDSGRIYLFAGPLDGSETLSSPDKTFDGVEDGDKAWRATFADDLTGGGGVELVVGAAEAEAGGNDRGAIYVIDDPWTVGASLGSATTLVSGAAIGPDIGGDWTTGDLNGDGFEDFVVGAYGVDAEYWSGGSAYLLHGPLPGDVSVEDADVTLRGEESVRALSEGLFSGHDLDGDGYEDLLLSADNAEQDGVDLGVCMVLSGPIPDETSLDDLQTEVWGVVPDGRLGCDDFAGDVDGDGQGDLVASAYNEEHQGTLYAGAVYLMNGPLSGSIRVTSARVRLHGDLHGASVGGAIGVDVDADGFDDVMVRSNGGFDPIVDIFYGGGF